MSKQECKSFQMMTQHLIFLGEDSHKRSLFFLPVPIPLVGLSVGRNGTSWEGPSSCSAVRPLGIIVSANGRAELLLGRSFPVNNRVCGDTVPADARERVPPIPGSRFTGRAGARPSHSVDTRFLRTRGSASLPFRWHGLRKTRRTSMNSSCGCFAQISALFLRQSLDIGAFSHYLK